MFTLISNSSSARTPSSSSSHTLTHNSLSLIRCSRLHLWLSHKLIDRLNFASKTICDWLWPRSRLECKYGTGCHSTSHESRRDSRQAVAAAAADGVAHERITTSHTNKFTLIRRWERWTPRSNRILLTAKPSNGKSINAEFSSELIQHSTLNHWTFRNCKANRDILHRKWDGKWENWNASASVIFVSSCEQQPESFDNVKRQHKW